MRVHFDLDVSRDIGCGEAIPTGPHIWPNDDNFERAIADLDPAASLYRFVVSALAAIPAEKAI